MYYLHPNQILVDLFQRKPFQGVAPENAKILFIGLDANYSKNIESDAIFSKIIEYHEDGELFWKSYGVHHPLLQIITDKANPVGLATLAADLGRYA